MNFFKKPRNKDGHTALLYAMELLRTLFPTSTRYKKPHYSKNWPSRQGDLVRKKKLKFPVTRQQVRAALRAECFQQITTAFPGEPRTQRRILALARAQNRYKAQTTGVLA